MPQNKKPAGARTGGKNFDPKYGSKTSYQDRKRRPDAADSSKPGSKSPKHRGYRAEPEDAPAKRRWNADDRAARGGRDDRGTRSYDNRDGGSSDRGARSYDSRGAGASDSRGSRSYNSRDDRSSDNRSSDRPRFNDDRKTARSGDAPRGGYNDSARRDSRPSFDKDAAPRGGRDGQRSGGRSYDTRGSKDSRGGYESRGGSDSRGSYNRSSSDNRGSEGRSSYDSRGGSDNRGGYNRGSSDSRGSYNRGSDSRGSYNRGADSRSSYDSRGGADNRGTYNSGSSDNRGGYTKGADSRGSYNRGSSDNRGSYNNRDDRSSDNRSSERPRFNDDRKTARSGDAPRGGYNDSARRDSRPSFDKDAAPRGGRDGYRANTERPQRRTEGGNRSDWNAPAATKAREQHIDVVHERLQAEAIDAGSMTGASFAELGLGENLVRVLNDLGAAKPFPIQAATVGPILDGRDVLARGRTGSGKTIAFGAPLVESILRSQAGTKREFGRTPKALIMAPTRELALQIDRTVQALARSVGLFTTQIYGGVPQARQVGALRKGVDIIIGTPGRIEDLVNQGKLDLSEVRISVLDEGDHMCELGFLEPVQRILRHTAQGSQKLLFSATLDREVAALVDEFLVKPAVYEVAGEDQDSGTIDHRVLVIDHRNKAEILNSLVDREGKTLVFARTRAYAEMLAEQFDDAGISAVALHGDLNQAKRTRNLQRLTSGRVQVLVATDVAARGIHVDDIDLVIQADAPDEYKTYLHRSGRTGRAGRQGTVVTLIPRQRRRRMTEMLERAEIDAPFDDASIGDDLLEELSGRQLANVAG